jgi:hypothetical protein
LKLLEDLSLLKNYSNFDGKKREIGTFMPIPSDGILELERFLNIDVKPGLDGSIGWFLESKVRSWLKWNFGVM